MVENPDEISLEDDEEVNPEESAVEDEEPKENPDEIALEDEEEGAGIVSEEKAGCGCTGAAVNPDEIDLEMEDEDELVVSQVEAKVEAKVAAKEEERERTTRFLALSKPGFGKDFLQVCSLPLSCSKMVLTIDHGRLSTLRPQQPSLAPLVLPHHQLLLLPLPTLPPTPASTPRPMLPLPPRHATTRPSTSTLTGCPSSAPSPPTSPSSPPPSPSPLLQHSTPSSPPLSTGYARTSATRAMG